MFITLPGDDLAVLHDGRLLHGAGSDEDGHARVGHQRHVGGVQPERAHVGDDDGAERVLRHARARSSPG